MGGRTDRAGCCVLFGLGVGLRGCGASGVLVVVSCWMVDVKGRSLVDEALVLGSRVLYYELEE